MEVSIIFKIAAVGILVSVLSQVLKHSGSEEQAFLVSLAGLLVVLFWIVPYIYELFDSIKNYLNCDLIHQYPVACVQEVENGHYKDFVTRRMRCYSWISYERNQTGIRLFYYSWNWSCDHGTCCGKIYYLFESLGKIQETLPVDTEYISTLVKMIGITYIGQFASGICKDAGYSTTAAQIELFCKLSVMVLSMPVLMALLKTIQEFMV